MTSLLRNLALALITALALAATAADAPREAEVARRGPDVMLFDLTALHIWFDAQVSDHGPDAMAGHEHMQHGGVHKP